jgi:hypothetical protein
MMTPSYNIKSVRAPATLHSHFFYCAISPVINVSSFDGIMSIINFQGNNNARAQVGAASLILFPNLLSELTRRNHGTEPEERIFTNNFRNLYLGDLC